MVEITQQQLLEQLQSQQKQSVAGADEMTERDRLTSIRRDKLDIRPAKVPVIVLSYFNKETWATDHPEHAKIWDAKVGSTIEVDGKDVVVTSEMKKETAQWVTDNVVYYHHSVGINFNEADVKAYNNGIGDDEGYKRLSTYASFPVADASYGDLSSNLYGAIFDPITWAFQNRTSIKANCETVEEIQHQTEAYIKVWDLNDGLVRYVKLSTAQVRGVSDEWYRKPCYLQLVQDGGGKRKVLKFSKLTLVDEHRQPEDIDKANDDLFDMNIYLDRNELSLERVIEEGLDGDYYNNTVHARRSWMDKLDLQNLYPDQGTNLGEALWTEAEYRAPVLEGDDLPLETDEDSDDEPV